MTAAGLKKIEDIEVGDLVLAYDEETGEQTYKEVVRLFRNETEEWYHVRVHGEEIVCTGGHPFYVVGEGFVCAKNLKVSDRLLLSDGEYAIIEEIEVEELANPETTYNFEVEEFHTYYVAESNILAHNKCNIDKQFKTYEEAEKYFYDELGEGAKSFGKTSYGESLYKSADGLQIGYLDKSHHPYRPRGMKFSPEHFNIQVKNFAGKVIKDIHIFWGRT